MKPLLSTMTKQYLGLVLFQRIKDLITYQIHHHTCTYCKMKTCGCQFGFPVPPMPKTLVLGSITFENEETSTNRSGNTF